MGMLRSLLKQESGQDLVEYSLLIVFVLIASTVIMQQTGSSMVPVWVAGNATVGNAATLVAGSPSTPTPAPAPAPPREDR